jgi:hypothetical protein
MDAFKFNQLYSSPANRQLIQKAMLTSATGVAEATIPEHLEDIITNTAVRLVPELAVPVLKYDPQKFHEFNRVISIPSAGSAQGEASTTQTKRSVYTRDSVQLKVMKRKGAVTGYLKDASTGYLEQPAAEMENHVQSFGNDIRTYLLFGNKGADQYTFDGLDRFIATNRVNQSVGGVVPTDLSLLNAMLDANTRRQGAAHRKVFLMSPELLSKFSELWTIVRDNREAKRGSNVIAVDGGYRLETYRNVPILETSATRPLTTMGTVTTASAGSGGAIPDDQYFFRVAAVTWDGEQLASAEVDETTSNADTLTLSFSAVDNALFYKVYCGDTTGVLTLVKIVSAFTYDSDGTVSGDVTSIVFSSNPLTPDSTSVPTHMQDDVPLVATGGVPPEYLILWDLDEFQGMGKLAYTNTKGSRFRGLITPMELAQTDDNHPFLLKSYSALVDAFEETSYMIRGVRIA